MEKSHSSFLRAGIINRWASASCRAVIQDVAGRTSGREAIGAACGGHQPVRRAWQCAVAQSSGGQGSVNSTASIGY